MDFDLNRMTQLLMATLMTLASVIVLGPGAPSIFAQHAAERAMARLRRPFRQAQGEDRRKNLKLSLSKHELR